MNDAYRQRRDVCLERYREDLEIDDFEFSRHHHAVEELDLYRVLGELGLTEVEILRDLLGEGAYRGPGADCSLIEG